MTDSQPSQSTRYDPVKDVYHDHNGTEIPTPAENMSTAPSGSVVPAESNDDVRAESSDAEPESASTRHNETYAEWAERVGPCTTGPTGVHLFDLRFLNPMCYRGRKQTCIRCRWSIAPVHLFDSDKAPTNGSDTHRTRHVAPPTEDRPTYINGQPANPNVTVIDPDGPMWMCIEEGCDHAVVSDLKIPPDCDGVKAYPGERQDRWEYWDRVHRTPTGSQRVTEVEG